MTHHILLGVAEAGTDHYVLNLGRDTFEDYIIDLPEGKNEFNDIEINAENCSVSFQGTATTNIKLLTIKSIKAIYFSGGVNIGTLRVQAPDITFNCNSNTINKVEVSHYDTIDYDFIRATLPGICWTPGSGNVFARSSYAEKSLAELREQLPGVKWVSPIITWAANSKDIADCKIYPGIEEASQESLWVATSDAKPTILSRDPSNSALPNFGRSYSDEEVVHAFSLAKEKGYKTCFTPTILIDQPGKPWRGFISGNCEDVEKFFNEQYMPFIMHYAELLKGKVDAFIIGSELEGLTKIHSKTYDFPMVKCLIKLACAVKEVLGSGVKITYAANWSEYHHVDGGYRPLDALWGCPNIDAVGINAYFPLTDKTTSSLTSFDVKEGWYSGEGYEYYLNGADKVPFDGGDWAWKNIRHWWSTKHYSAGKPTAWVPCSKKIWFTELGFASIDKTTNQPNVFYNPDALETNLPKNSTGHTSIEHMLRAYRGSLELWGRDEVVENILAWSWDARSIGWQNDIESWADHRSWHYSHSLEGKLPTISKEVVLRGALKTKILIYASDKVIIEEDSLTTIVLV